MYAPIIASLLANFITKFVKPRKLGLTEDQMESRKTLVRVLNAILGLIGVIAITLLTGSELDATAVSTFIEVIVNAGMAFAMSQGVYFLSK
jgi:hypothetical protein